MYPEKQVIYNLEIEGEKKPQLKPTITTSIARSRVGNAVFGYSENGQWFPVAMIRPDGVIENLDHGGRVHSRKERLAF